MENGDMSLEKDDISLAPTVVAQDWSSSKLAGVKTYC
jgi:hypothetical protein